MEKTKVQEEVIRTIETIQFECGEEREEITKETIPLLELLNFDSLRAFLVLYRLAEQFKERLKDGITLDEGISVFVDAENKNKPRSIEEISNTVRQYLK